VPVSQEAIVRNELLYFVFIKKKHFVIELAVESNSFLEKLKVKLD